MVITIEQLVLKISPNDQDLIHAKIKITVLIGAPYNCKITIFFNGSEEKQMEVTFCTINGMLLLIICAHVLQWKV